MDIIFSLTAPYPDIDIVLCYRDMGLNLQLSTTKKIILGASLILRATKEIQRERELASSKLLDWHSSLLIKFAICIPRRLINEAIATGQIR